MIKSFPTKFLQPIHMALVFELFTLRLDYFANESKVLIAVASDCSEPPNIIITSSANCDKIFLTSPILTPLISLFCLNQMRYYYIIPRSIFFH